MAKSQGLPLLTNILPHEFILWVFKLSNIKPIYWRYWRGAVFRVEGRGLYKDWHIKRGGVSF